MIKLLIGGSPCTFWSIAQKNGRETEAEGMGWELFKNYLIAKEKFKPDFFLYENNKSAAQAIKDSVKKELGVWDETLLMEDTGARYIEINSSLVSAQNRQRFYVHNCGEVEQPEDRGILLKDILETNTTENCYCIAEPIRVPEYGVEDKSRPITASYAYKGDGEGSLASEAFPDNPNKQVRDYVAEPIRIGALPRPNGELSTSQAKRVYSIDGKSVNLVANGGGEGAKTGLYAVPCPVNVTDNGKSQTIKAQYDKTSIANICCYSSTYGATGVAIPTNKMPTETFIGDGKDKKAMQRVYEVKGGLITIKGKQYPIKLADGYYIIRKLTPIECERLQTLPDNYTAAVSNTQRYKGLGNGWTAEVIIHILNGALKDVPRDEEIIVLSMYDGIGTGRYCLDKMGFTNVKYYAYEIDKYAKQIAMSNYPDIIQMGDAFDLRHPDWTIGY